MARTFKPFACWTDVRHAAETNVPLYYHAPLDLTPCRVLARRVFKNGKLRLTSGDVSFTADAGHLERFRYLADPEPSDKARRAAWDGPALDD